MDRVARGLGIPVIVFHPRSWNNKDALLEKNCRLVEWCDKLIAIFVDGYARKLGKPVEAYLVDTLEKRIQRVYANA